MKIALGSDHGGYELKKMIVERLTSLGHTVDDLGCHSSDMVDYPVYAGKVAKAVISGDCVCGILICGTGIGMSIAANKISGIRAALCADCFSAKMAKEHNNANIIAIGARTTGPELAWMIVEAYLGSEFQHGIHDARVRMLNELDE
ncbi:MAG: ribose 5-phosphate isomerase B [Lachnospiraceae bacterium]|nr:ribose 5-phosphate isomerase B [Lachnospiraceae bacterium]